MAVRRHRAAVLLAASTLLTALLPATATQAASARPTQTGTEVHTVTLVTGDRVDVVKRGDRLEPRVRRGENREGMQFAVSQYDGHLRVIPQDALRLLAEDKLDPRLFDVTELIRLGYHDKGRRDLPLLVQGTRVSAKADDVGGTVTRSIPELDTVALRQPKKALAEFWSDMTSSARTLDTGVSKIWLDGKREISLDESVPQVGAPAAWEQGYTGKGVKVAVLDTGVDTSHPDLKYRVAAKKDFTGTGINDTVGHGTHVASTIAGSGSASKGRFKGVAPSSDLLIGKVCEEYGCTESAILAGMEWAAKAKARVVNVSLGGYDAPGQDPVERAVDRLSESSGTLFVVAAGNEGDDETVSSPASADAALAVGAVDKQDKLADFSSRGPRSHDGVLKPEITAPGVSITAANAKDGFLGEPGRKYTTLNGTSMATPHVAGAAAILAQRHRDWDGQQIKSALVGAAKRLPNLSAFKQGAGRLDVAQALKHSRYATPAAVSAGVTVWPHDDDKSQVKTLTYRNPTASAVTLNLTSTTLGPDDKPAADGTFALSSDKVTVPAKGKASVKVTVDTSTVGPDGAYSAWITATSSATKITTPVAVTKEVESYNLTLDLTDRLGRPGSAYLAVAINLESGRAWETFDGDGAEKIRVPKGDYHVFTFLDTPPSPGSEGAMSLVSYPKFSVDGDSTVPLDARKAKPVKLTVDDPGAKPIGGEVGYAHKTPFGLLNVGLISDDPSSLNVAHLGPDLPADHLVGIAAVNLAVPGPDGDIGKSTRLYDLAYFQRGAGFTGLTRHEKQADLARIESAYHSHGSNKGAFRLRYASPSDDATVGTGAGAFNMPLPFNRTEFVNTDGLDWSGELWLENGDAEDGALFDTQRTYESGKSYQEVWNNVVYAPAADDSYAVRDKDQIVIGASLNGDGAGHGGYGAGSGRTVLYRDGEQVFNIAEPGYVDTTVPAAESSYRMVVTETRRGSKFGTSKTAEWTFRSSHTTEETPLRLLSVGFAPKVDRYGWAQDGQTQQVPVRVAASEGPNTVTSLTVEVSFDGGSTWKKVPVTSTNGKWSAKIAHPVGTKFVALRTEAADADGNTVKETLLRAYGIH